jgi:hypothetical protein
MNRRLFAEVVVPMDWSPTPSTPPPTPAKTKRCVEDAVPMEWSPTMNRRLFAEVVVPMDWSPTPSTPPPTPAKTKRCVEDAVPMDWSPQSLEDPARGKRKRSLEDDGVSSSSSVRNSKRQRLCLDPFSMVDHVRGKRKRVLEHDVVSSSSLVRNSKRQRASTDPVVAVERMKDPFVSWSVHYRMHVQVDPEIVGRDDKLDDGEDMEWDSLLEGQDELELPDVATKVFHCRYKQKKTFGPCLRTRPFLERKCKENVCFRARPHLARVCKENVRYPK